MTKGLAHRGFSGKYPENTMLAFEKAVQEGCSGMELDVQLTLDGIPVIIHDESLDRTTNSTGNGFIFQKTYDEIKLLNASGKFASTGIVTPVPRFVELLDFVKGTNLLLNIELKNNCYFYPGLEKAVVDLIRKYKMEEQCIFASFNNESLLICRELAPEIPICFITSSWLYDPVHYLKHANMHHIQPIFSSLSKERIKEYKESNVTVFAWTPNTEAEMQSLFQNQVNYIITDNIDVFNKASCAFL